MFPDAWEHYLKPIEKAVSDSEDENVEPKKSEGKMEEAATLMLELQVCLTYL